MPEVLPSTTTENIIMADDPDLDSSDYVTDSSAPVENEDGVQYRGFSTGSKETTYMKLKNKIRQLENHLNLSST